jgi:phosphoribosylaminoimidazole carboxylase PurE protein
VTLAVIVMGSPADRDHARAIADALRGFHVGVVQRVGSAHRTPEHVLALLRDHDADPRPKVFITVAGRSNALSGFTDPQVSAPVIACPPPGPEVDAWSSLRMPPGVGCAVVLEAVNAALFAAKVLSAHDPQVARAVAAFQAAQRDRVTTADDALQAAHSTRDEGSP